jgi:hypothetical protein
VIRVERSWDPVKGPVDVKTGAGRRAVPMAFVVRRELMTHKQRTNRDGPDLVFGRTKTEAFFASTIRARANKAWTQAGLEPITPHEERHCAISYFIAAGLDWKQMSTWAGHGDVRQTWNRYGHLVPGGEEQARERLDAYLNPPKPIPTVAHAPQNDETTIDTGDLKYRYRDSNPIADRCDQWVSSVYRRSRGSRRGSFAKIGPRLVRGAKASSISSDSRSPGM